MNTFYTTLGLRGVTELPKHVNLYGSLGWQHAYGDKNTSSRMAFAGSDAFITQGQAVDEDVMVGDIGVSVQLSRAATLDVGYQDNMVRIPASTLLTPICAGRSELFPLKEPALVAGFCWLLTKLGIVPNHVQQFVFKDKQTRLVEVTCS